VNTSELFGLLDELFLDWRELSLLFIRECLLPLFNGVPSSESSSVLAYPLIKLSYEALFCSHQLADEFSGFLRSSSGVSRRNPKDLFDSLL